MNTHILRSLIVVTSVVVSACSGNSATGPTTTPPVNFAGNYTGTYSVAGCTEDPGFSGFCAAGFPLNTRLPISLSLGQNGTSVTGNVLLGGISGNFQGTATGSGLQGTATLNPITSGGLTVTANVTSWTSTLSNSSMSGNFVVQYSVPALGSARVTGSILQLTR